jgi:hypothetical protein
MRAAGAGESDGSTTATDGGAGLQGAGRPSSSSPASTAPLSRGRADFSPFIFAASCAWGAAVEFERQEPRSPAPSDNRSGRRAGFAGARGRSGEASMAEALAGDASVGRAVCVLALQERHLRRGLLGLEVVDALIMSV